jgi:hypothetical protein
LRVFYCKLTQTCTVIFLAIKEIRENNIEVFQLKTRVTVLSPVVVVSTRLKEKKIGIVKEKVLLHFIYGNIIQNDIFEIAHLIDVGKANSKITSLILFLSQSRKDSAIFRIKFYHYEDKKPSARLIEEEVI